MPTVLPFPNELHTLTPSFPENYSFTHTAMDSAHRYSITSQSAHPFTHSRSSSQNAHHNTNTHTHTHTSDELHTQTVRSLPKRSSIPSHALHIDRPSNAEVFAIRTFFEFVSSSKTQEIWTSAPFLTLATDPLGPKFCKDITAVVWRKNSQSSNAFSWNWCLPELAYILIILPNSLTHMTSWNWCYGPTVSGVSPRSCNKTLREFSE
jgi:hypothetical protein